MAADPSPNLSSSIPKGTRAWTWHCRDWPSPAQLTLRTTPEGIRLCREPSDENKNLRTSQKAWRDVTESPGENPLADVHGDLLDLRADLEMESATAFSLEIRGQRIHYSPKDEELAFYGVKTRVTGGSKRIFLQVLGGLALSVEIFSSINGEDHALARGDLRSRSP